MIGKAAVWGLIGAMVLCVFLGTLLQIRSLELELCEQSHKQFVADTKAEGEAAARSKKTIDDANLARKKVADEESKRVVAQLRADAKRLRDERNSRGSPVPSPTPGATNPETICFNRAELGRDIREGFERFVGRLDQRLLQADESIAELNVAKRWAQQ